MYTLKRGTEITAKVISGIIEHNEGHRERFDKLEAYYIGRHEIIDRVKTVGLSNNRVIINHAKYITDTNTGYLVSAPIEYQVTEGYDIEAVKDSYKRQTISDLDSEIAKDLSIFGMQYEYVYANEEAQPCSAEIDNRNAVLVFDTTLEHGKLFGIIYAPVFEGDSKDSNPIGYDVTYCDDTFVKEFELRGDDFENLTEMSSKPHAFGEVPLIQYRNNSEYLGDFEPVINLIDAYNLLQSDRVNDKEQLVDAILVLINMDFDEEQIVQLKKHRVLSKVPPDGDVKYLIKTLNESDTDILRKNIEDDIHKVAMVPNMSDTSFIGNASGVAIRYKLLLFEQNISNKERYMEKGLMERFALYNNFLVTASKMQTVPITEVDAIFKRNLPQNDYEISQMINNLVNLVDKETLVSQLSFVKDAKETIEAAMAEQQADNVSNDGALLPADEIPDGNSPGVADLTVAQTNLLLRIIGNIKKGVITLEQGANSLSRTLGISIDEAMQLIGDVI